MLQGLGQVPFDPPNVKGWAGGESWISTYTLLLRQQFLRRMIEATTVAPMDSGMRMADRHDRRAERREQLPAAETMQMMDPPRPVEGRSLRNAGNEVRLGRCRQCRAAAHAAATSAGRWRRCQRECGRDRGRFAARHGLPVEVRRAPWAVFSCWSN
jgi:hypothetical protein